MTEWRYGKAAIAGMEAVWWVLARALSNLPLLLLGRAYICNFDVKPVLHSACGVEDDVSACHRAPNPLTRIKETEKSENFFFNLGMIAEGPQISEAVHLWAIKSFPYCRSVGCHCETYSKRDILSKYKRFAGPLHWKIRVSSRVSRYNTRHQYYSTSICPGNRQRR